jgi:hypothetical protein
MNTCLYTFIWSSLCSYCLMKKYLSYYVVCCQCWCEVDHLVPASIVNWLLCIALFYRLGRLQTPSHSSHGHLFGLAVLYPSARSRVLSSCTYCTHTHTTLSTYTSMDGNSNSIHEHYMIIIYWFNFILENQLDQLAQNTLIGNSLTRHTGSLFWLWIQAVEVVCCVCTARCTQGASGCTQKQSWTVRRGTVRKNYSRYKIWSRISIERIF